MYKQTTRESSPLLKQSSPLIITQLNLVSFTYTVPLGILRYTEVGILILLFLRLLHR